MRSSHALDFRSGKGGGRPRPARGPGPNGGKRRPPDPLDEQRSGEPRDRPVDRSEPKGANHRRPVSFDATPTVRSSSVSSAGIPSRTTTISARSDSARARIARASGRRGWMPSILAGFLIGHLVYGLSVGSVVGAGAHVQLRQLRLSTSRGAGTPE